jgi:hypothetical protein
MILHRVYIKRTEWGYYVCYSALRNHEINVRPFATIVPAMEFAKEAVKMYRTRQREINVRDC